VKVTSVTPRDSHNCDRPRATYDVAENEADGLQLINRASCKNDMKGEPRNDVH